jgi:hypothetical protein
VCGVRVASGSNGDDTNLSFAEDQWSSMLMRAQKMDDLVTRHSAIMDHSKGNGFTVTLPSKSVVALEVE